MEVGSARLGEFVDHTDRLVGVVRAGIGRRYGCFLVDEVWILLKKEPPPWAGRGIAPGSQEEQSVPPRNRSSRGGPIHGHRSSPAAWRMAFRARDAADGSWSSWISWLATMESPMSVVAISPGGRCGPGSSDWAAAISAVSSARQESTMPRSR